MELPGGAPYGPAYTGGIRLALGDNDGDGRADIVAAPGPGYPPLVRIFSSADHQLHHRHRTLRAVGH